MGESACVPAENEDVQAEDGGGCEVEQRASLVEQAQQKAHQSTQEAGSCMVLK